VSGSFPATAIVSPLPPARTGVAEYSLRIGSELAKHGPVELLRPDEVARARDFEKVIYQIGNNGLHAPIYHAALEHPGIVELHDAVIHHMLLGTLSESEYLKAFKFNSGKDGVWLQSVGQEMWDRRGGSGSDERYFANPMLDRLVQSANAVIVHNPGARRSVERVAAHPRIWEIPHYVAAPPREDFGSDAELRSRWSLPTDAFIVSCFGYQRPTKRLASLLEAVRQLGGSYRLLVVGDFVDREYESALADRLDAPEIVRIPYVDDDDFWRLTFLTDVCVNLRYPSAGETSGIALKLMAAGKTVIVTDNDENSSFPNGTVIRVDAGEAEVEMLAEYLEWLRVEPDVRLAIGGAAGAYVRENHSIARVIGDYTTLLQG
jgi:glycosyltransferase involved in cell wall biosynthesis